MGRRKKLARLSRFGRNQLTKIPTEPFSCPMSIITVIVSSGIYHLSHRTPDSVRYRLLGKQQRRAIPCHGRTLRWFRPTRHHRQPIHLQELSAAEPKHTMNTPRAAALSPTLMRARKKAQSLTDCGVSSHHASLRTTPTMNLQSQKWKLTIALMLHSISFLRNTQLSGYTTRKKSPERKGKTRR